MKKIRVISVVAAVVAMALPNNYSAAADEYCSSITYIKLDNEAVITGYTGNPEIINLPSQIDGASVTKIRENAFYKCSTLKKIIIPQSVSEIGRHAFYECTALETAEINGNAEQIPEGLFYGCEKLKDVSLKISPTMIGDYAFFGCTSLSEFNMPISVKNIGSYCFAECTELSELHLSKNLCNIEEYSFYDCSKLNKINLPESLLSIGRCAIGFSNNGILSGFSITGIPDSIAEHYANDMGIKFINRIRYNDQSNLNIPSGFLTWIFFAVIYVLLMIVLVTGRKKYIRFEKHLQ